MGLLEIFKRNNVVEKSEHIRADFGSFTGYEKYALVTRIETHVSENGWKTKHAKFGIINNEEKVVLKIEYDWISNFSCGVAVIIKNRLWGIVSDQGEILVPVIYKKFLNIKPQSDYVDFRYKVDPMDESICPYFAYTSDGNLIAITVNGETVIVPILAQHQEKFDKSNVVYSVKNGNEKSPILKDTTNDREQ